MARAAGAAAEDVSSLRTAEGRLQAAQQASDVDVLDELLHPRLTFVGPDGALTGKELDLEVHREGAIDIRTLDPLDLVVNVVSGVGVTVLTARLVGTYQGTAFDTVFRYTRTWTRESGSWRVLAARATMVTHDE